jgi:hypothetical protein
MTRDGSNGSKAGQLRVKIFPATASRHDARSSHFEIRAQEGCRAGNIAIFRMREFNTFFYSQLAVAWCDLLCSDYCRRKRDAKDILNHRDAKGDF